MRGIKKQQVRGEYSWEISEKAGLTQRGRRERGREREREREREERECV